MFDKSKIIDVVKGKHSHNPRGLLLNTLSNRNEYTPQVRTDCVKWGLNRREESLPIMSNETGDFINFQF